jgi:predicted dehydrogenase
MTINLGMLGVYHPHAHGIVRQVAAHPDEFRLTAGFDPDANVAADRKSRWKELLPDWRLCSTAEELLDQPLDGVIVEGLVHENLRWARMAVERGLPVMLEKPPGTSLDEFRQLIDLARRKGVRVQLIYLFRYMSAVLEMFRLNRDGVFGDIYEFRARLPKDLRFYDEHVREYAPYTGGIFFEMAGHMIDMMVTLLGRPKSITPFLAHHHDRPGEFIDNGLAVFEYDHAWGIIEVTALELAPDARRIEVFGTEGACAIPNLGSGHLQNEATQPIEVYRADQPQWRRLELPAATLQISDLREFAACIRGEKRPDYASEHDLIVQEALLEAVSASRA